MKVCLANDSFPPQIDGVENTVVNYANIITDKYGSAVVATPEYPGSDDSQFGFDVVRYPSIYIGKKIGYRAGYPFSAEAMEKLSSFRPNIIHSHCPMMSAYLCRELRSITGAPIVFTYHTKFDIEIRRALKLKLLQEHVISLMINNIEACDDVWVVSEGAGENLNSMGYRGTYTVMNNGVDMPKAPANEPLLAQIRAQYGLTEDIPVFLSVGRMRWYKGQKITLDGLKKAKDVGKKFKMVFIGDGNDKKEMERYAKNLGLSDSCIFTGAIYDRELLRTWYCLADLFLFPSTYDTNGIVVREAAACSLGSVIVKDSCAAEGITDGRNGILIEENSDSMADVIIEICDHRDAAARIGQNAAEEIYISWEQAVDKAVSRYAYIIDMARHGDIDREHVSFDKRIDTLADFYKGMERLKKQNKKILKSLENKITRRKP